MKRIFLILLVVLIAALLMLTGCGKDAPVTRNPSSSSEDSSQSDEQPGPVDDTNSTGLDSDSSSNSPEQSSPADEQSSPADEKASPDGEQSSPDIDVDITEKMYVAYINEIYVNTEDYIGQTIRIQGMYQAYTDENTGQTYYYVYRVGPGCCGNDGSMCGFEFTWDGQMPKDNDWIEVVGSLRSYDEDGWTYLTLDAESVTVMDVRGAETVSQ